MEVKVSAVITTYKRDKMFLERAIKSVLNQTYKNIELLIVDDNGMDSSYSDIVQSLVDQYSDKLEIKYLLHEINAGAQKARNTGIENSTGMYLAFLDDDDAWLEAKIEKQLKIFEKSNSENLGLVYCWYNVLTEQIDGNVLTEVYELPVYPKNQVLKELLRKNYIASTSFPLIKKECFDSVGTFDEALEASQDYDMWVRIAQKYEVDCAQEPLVEYYKHIGERITNNPAKKARAEKMFLDKYYNEIKKDKIALSDKNKKIGIYLMRSGNGKEARKYFKMSLKYESTNFRIYKYIIESFILEKKLK